MRPTVATLLHLARRAALAGQLHAAELIFHRALKSAESLHGITSPEAALVSLELEDFFSEQGRNEEALAQRARVRKILSLNCD